MSVETLDYIEWFRNAAPYVRAHRGATFVIAVGGEVFRSKGRVHLAEDLALIQSLGTRLVIVAGSRPQIDEALKRAGQKPTFVHGLRVTDAEALEAAKGAAGKNRVELERLLSSAMPGSPLAGAKLRVAAGNFVTARPIGVLEGVDYQYTGRVRRVDAEGIKQRLDDGAIVALTPLGYSMTGECFNISTPELAAKTAIALGAEKLISLTESSGLRSAREGSRADLGQLTADAARAKLKSKRMPLDLRMHLEACALAVESGVPRAHLLERRSTAGLLRELYTREGIGTLITASPHERVRRGCISDVPALMRLLEPLERDGMLVRRSQDVLENDAERFFVIERDDQLLGCAALYPYPASKMAELACLAVAPEHREGGRGDRLLEALVEAARAQGIERLFALTTQSAHWFRERGFAPGKPSQLPSERPRYDRKRRSMVLFKPL